MKLRRTLSYPGAISLLAATAIWASSDAEAADHQEAGTLSGADPAADIGDLYVWHGDDKVRVVLTFAGYRLRTDDPVYDDDVLYRVHFDTDGDNLPDVSVDARFGQDAQGDWGYQISSVPGSSAAISAAVGETVTDGGVQATAGYFDDPFFFDLQGFQDTLSTGDLSFDATRDFVAVKNTSAIVFEFDASELSSTSFKAWATTGRK